MVKKSPVKRKRQDRFLIVLMVIILYVIESMVSVHLPTVEGVRLGLSNIPVLYALVMVNAPFAYVAMTIKAIVGPLLMGNAGMIIYSLPAGLISLSMMVLVKRKLGERLGIVGISIIGAVCHNLMLYGICAWQLSSIMVFVQTPAVLAVSTVAGSVTGSMVYLIIQIKNKINIMRKQNANS